MSNTYFQFKQFRIEQDRCAMKVSTDACILGAYTAQNGFKQALNILDIGAGTGLLSLMLAQVTQAQITAIEIDRNAYVQAKENFEKSNWADRLQVFHLPIQEYNAGNQYDLLICNPPFFVNSLKSPKQEKTWARHTDSLPFADLLGCVEKLASEQATFTVLLPIKESQLFENEINARKNKFYISEKLFVQDNLSKLPHRVILVVRLVSKHVTLSQTTQDMITKQNEKILIIKGLTNQYTQDFINLMKDYYLHL
jgi:tRNA1Val (adenine37-N6)-methyltransferase